MSDKSEKNLYTAPSSEVLSFQYGQMLCESLTILTGASAFDDIEEIDLNLF